MSHLDFLQNDDEDDEDPLNDDGEGLSPFPPPLSPFVSAGICLRWNCLRWWLAWIDTLAHWLGFLSLPRLFPSPSPLSSLFPLNSPSFLLPLPSLLSFQDSERFRLLREA